MRELKTVGKRRGDKEQINTHQLALVKGSAVEQAYAWMKLPKVK